MYEIKTDIHTHTIESRHAYCTIGEYVAQAKKIGVELVGMTDHGPAMGGAPHFYYFLNLSAIPHMVDGVWILKGAEANVIDFEGNVDLEDRILKKLDVVIASMHESVIIPGTMEDHTNAYLNIVHNPLIDVIGHSGNPNFKYDYERVIAECAKYDTIMEINNHSFEFRKGSAANCKEIARLCKKYGAYIAVNSDAHFYTEMGVYGNSVEVLKELDFPEEKIINRNARVLLDFLSKKKGIRFAGE